MGIAATVLSASLWHTNLSTIDDLYRTTKHTKASIEANHTIVNLLQMHNNQDDIIDTTIDK